MDKDAVSNSISADVYNRTDSATDAAEQRDAA